MWKMSLAIVGFAATALGCNGGSDVTVPPDQGPAAKIVIISGDAQTSRSAHGARRHVLHRCHELAIEDQDVPLLVRTPLGPAKRQKKGEVDVRNATRGDLVSGASRSSL